MRRRTKDEGRGTKDDKGIAFFIVHRPSSIVHRNKAFTLVELIVNIILISILVFGISFVFMEGFRSYWINKNLIALRSEARAALKRMAFEIRIAQGVTLASSEDVSINSDIDDDGAIEVVRYYKDSDNIRRQVDGSPSPGSVMMGYVSSAAFSLSGANSVILSMTLSKNNDKIIFRTKVRLRCV